MLTAGCCAILVSTAVQAQQNIALNQPAVASSTQAGLYIEDINDGDAGTRWGSEWTDAEWVYVDLGASLDISQVVLQWEGAYASDYTLQISDDASTWTDVATVTSGDGGEDSFDLDATARYVRMLGTLRATGYGYSLWEFEVYDGESEPPPPSGDLAEGQPVVASSYEGGFDPFYANDGDPATRWGSVFEDDEWIYVDLGSSQSFDTVVLRWEAAYGSGYKIQSSDDASAWTDVYTETAGDGGEDVLSVNGTGRYVRMLGTARGTAWGYSLWDFEVYGDGGTNPGGPVAVPLTGPYVEFIDLNLSPATLDGDVEVRFQNVVVDGVLNYDIGTEITVTKDFVSLGPNNDLDISALDAQGNLISGFPLTVTVYDGLELEVEVISVGGGGDLALNKTITASSVQAGLDPEFANDGDMATRWGSSETDFEWIQVDLGQVYSFKRVVLNWEGAYGQDYIIQVSDDGTTWSDALVVTGGNGGVDDLELDASGRYVRMQGVLRGSPYGYSLWDFEVYEEAGYNPDDIIADPYPTPEPLSVEGDFNLTGPVDQAMVTSTRTPTLNWDAVAGATRYDVYVNITKEDYDFTQPGSLLDRYTKVGESLTNGFTLTEPLTDRWTYKWYVVAVDGATDPRSDIHTFSLYLPEIEQVNDGINLINGARDLNKNGSIEPYEDWTQPIQTRVDDLLARMTLEEKAMQMFFDGQTYPLSGFHFGPLTPSDEEAMQLSNAATRLGIPAITTGDTIHGYKTTFPTQSALGAMKNYDLIRQLGDMQRREQLAVGARGTLSPLAEVGTKVLYPRIQEGCGEDADVAAAMVRAILVGLQAGPELNPDSLWVTTKHWPGQGAGGEQQMVYDGTTVHYHMRPWHAAIEAGTGGIMPGYGGTQLFGPSEAGAGDNPYILAYLREALGYDGLICSDWLPSGAWVGSAIAGSDVMGGAAPSVMGNFATEVPESTIDEHVRRILDMKFRLGIFENPYGDYQYGEGEWFTPDNYDLAVQASREAMTLLENNGILPIRLGAGSDIVVAGPFANTGNQWSIWTSGFHNASGARTPYEAIQERAAKEGINVYLDSAPTTPDLAVVLVGEPSYTHGTSWANAEPYLPADQIATIQSFQNAGVPVVLAYTMARPSVLNSTELSADALLLTYRAGDGGGTALAQVLFGDYVPTGTLPWQLPRSMAQIGTDDQNNQIEHWDLPFDIGATEAERAEIRALIAAGDPVPPIYGDPLYQYGYGLQNYGFSDTTAPASVALLSPSNGASFSPDLPAFSWTASADAESGIQHYAVYVDGALAAVTKTTSWDHYNLPLSNGSHTWEVRAVNWAGLEQSSGSFSFTLNDTTAAPSFDLVNPLNNANVAAGAPLAFFWEDVLDAGSGLQRYEFYYDSVKAGEFAPQLPITSNANLALHRPYRTSTTNQGTFDAVTDGDVQTRWSSDQFSPQWLTIDLGADYRVNRVVLNWEAAYATGYRILASIDGETWTELYSTVSGDGQIDDLTGLSGVARYLQVECLTAGSVYGYSLWEVEVYGDLLQGATIAAPGAGVHSWTIKAINGAGLEQQANETRVLNGQ